MVINPKVGEMENGVSAQGNMQAESVSGMVSVLKTAIENVSGSNGDIVIPVYLGGTMLDEVIVSAQQRANLRSGGR